MRRRDALVIGGAAAAALALPPVLRRLPSDFNFEPLPGVDGFRRLAGGSTSGGADVFFGLRDNGSTPADPEPSLPPSPCRALFGVESWPEETVPVAIFSDFNCPFCRVFEDSLLALEASGTPITLMWHELPLLGAGSYRAARAVLAAGLLGEDRAARAFLWSNRLPPGDAGLRRLAAALNLDAENLIRAERDPRVAETLRASGMLGRTLGIYGTPGTVIGRTLVIGAMRDPDLKKLIALERQDPRPVCP